MIRFYFRLSTPFLCLFTTLMVIIHAQPYDDHGLHALLTPDNCEMPCFMGITTADEAVKLLQANTWVDKVDIVCCNALTGSISSIGWDWSSQSPRLIQTADSADLSVHEGRVDYIYIPTSLSVGDVWLSRGIPSEYGLTTVQGLETSPIVMAVQNYYIDDQFGVSSEGIFCSYFSRLWNSQVTIYLTRDEKHIFVGNAVRDSLFRKQVFNLDRRICKG